MSTSSTGLPTPDEVAASRDPGDETASRYRFQWTWAAIVCCMLLDETQDTLEVFCEHHEDILIKHKDGTFSGHQIKTRASDQAVWKASDAQVKSACARFAVLDNTFPGQFRAFHFLSNHPFHAADNSQSLKFNLEQIGRSETALDLSTTVDRWIKAIATESRLSEAVVYLAMKRTQASDELPKLRDSTMRLIDSLTAGWSESADCNHEALKRSAQQLIEECGRASSLDHAQTLPAYVSALQSAESSMISAIAAKKMTAERVLLALQEGLNNTAGLITEPSRLSEPGRGSTELMFKKLDAGGFSAVSRNSAEDLRDKADYLGLTWTQRYGRRKGLERYEHVRSIALNDASRSFEATKNEAAKFGPEMREDMRRRFHERRVQGEQFFDCTDDHLEGVAYSLTSQCRVQWSINRPWEEE